MEEGTCGFDWLVITKIGREKETIRHTNNILTFRYIYFDTFSQGDLFQKPKTNP
jgi:hypothetical protein